MLYLRDLILKERLGSVVTNHGYSDWATTDISSDIKAMWYRFSRRGSDYCIECSQDGISFKQMMNDVLTKNNDAYKSVSNFSIRLMPGCAMQPGIFAYGL